MMEPMGDNRRQHERFSVYAQAELARDGEMVILSVRNLSTGGVFVEAPIGEYPNIKVGSRFELTISLAHETDDAGEPPPAIFARCIGRVVRRDRSNPPGFALVFERVAQDQLAGLRALIDTAPKR
jgi:hypothetical protein